jgi:hypothetical protein
MNISDAQRLFINQVVEEISEEWLKHHLPIPNVFYHYTSAEGLIGILSSKTIWMTELRYMNDMSELQYAKDKISSRLRIYIEKPNINDIQKEFLKRIVSAFDPFSSGNAVFSASFCESGNLLSQWRAYGGKGGGYAIGFDFLHTIRFLNKRCVLRKVIYDKQMQDNVVDGVIDKYLSAIAKETTGRAMSNINQDDFVPAICQAFSGTAGELMFSFKHPDFHEEKEWRLVHHMNINPRFNRSGEIPAFRSYDGNVIPYISVSFSNAAEASKDDTFGCPFPIVKLFIGPTINADLNTESIKYLLSNMNPDGTTDINKSDIPLRWL